MNENTTPAGYMKNSNGHLVPVETVSAIDKHRDEFVREIVEKARELNKALSQFKGGVMADIGAFVELSGEKYGAKMGGKKGNITLTTFDGQYKVMRAMSDSMTFDERIQVAKELIDQCIHRWASGTGAEIRALVEHAFQVDKQGKLNTARIFGLMRLDIKDDQWQQAMTALKDSIQVTGTKAYVRVYERVGDDQYRQIPLDMGSV
ncbi:MAG: DUF3164 family protein [Thiomicrospira sp.]